MVDHGLSALSEQGVINDLDLAFADFIVSKEQNQPGLMAVVAALISARTQQQSVCLPLDALLPYVSQWASSTDELQMLLQQANTLSDGSHPAPLIMQQGNLYLHRYWQYETQLASLLKALAGKQINIDTVGCKRLLEQLFGPAEAEPDWQRIAATVAAMKHFCVISGGPGTGKTTTVTRLMALIQGLHKAQGLKPLKIQLVAPTGKAAARLSESIAGARLKLPESLQQGLPEQCSTIHRLLGVIPNSQMFKHGPDNPLHLDMLIVDEASMVDLPLMTKLVGALPAHARLIFLGDKDQLASVEVGNVLGDICHKADFDNPYSEQMTAHIYDMCGYALQPARQVVRGIADNMVMLRKSYRFADDSAIGVLAKAIKEADVNGVLSLLSANEKNVQWQPNTKVEMLVREFSRKLVPYFDAVRKGNIEQAFSLLGRQQILCSSRKGIWGIENLNLTILNELSRLRLVDHAAGFFPGKALMLNQNDHRLQLYNGDVGIVMADPAQPEVLKVWFMDAQGNPREILPSRLPGYESAFAMTIHKSQGSEFEQVYICMEPSQMAVLNRQLLYTGVTRAKQQLTLYGSEAMLRQCLQQSSKRASGLAQRLSV